MIVDSVKNIMQYAPLVNNLKQGMDKVNSLKSYEEGRYEFEGGFFMIQKGTTKPMSEGTFEAHRKYVDVQIIVEGSEETAWDDIENLREAVPYNPDKDAIRYDGDREHVMKFTKGMFYIAFPHDAHKPVSHLKEQQSFTKIVMKLPV